MKVHRVGIIMNGVTGRMGTNQHLDRSLMAIRRQGGVAIGTDEVILPEPLLVGRNPNKLKALSERFGIERYTTDLDAALADDDYPVYFDALSTKLRVPSLRKAIAACEDMDVRYHVGNLLSSDTFYGDDPAAMEKWIKMGVLAIEMEAAALYMNAARCGKRALAICTVSDHILSGEVTTAAERQTSFTQMMEVALETAAAME